MTRGLLRRSRIYRENEVSLEKLNALQNLDSTPLYSS